jgi:aminoacrylate hydrolase
MPLFDAGDAQIWYEEHGSGPPLMMVAGLGGVGAYWIPNLPFFTPHFRVILHDQRGTGRSTRTPVRSIAQMANDARSLMSHLNIEHTAWLGHSTGAAIGVDLALDSPGRISRIVVNSSTTHGDAYRRRVFEIRRLLHADVGPAAYAKYTSLLLYPPWWINQHAARLDEEERSAAELLSPPDVQSSRLDAILSWDRRSEFYKLTLSTMVICAADDILTPPYFSEEFSRLIPHARLVRLTTGGHACSRTVPEMFNPCVLSFLREYLLAV